MIIETANNWYPGEQLLDRDDRFTVKSVNLLAARARTAFFEYVTDPGDVATPGRIYRTLPYGPQLELFFIDMRSHRGAERREPCGRGEGIESRSEARSWPVAQAGARRRASATWKVICSDMPLGLDRGGWAGGL